ncbi:MAG: hypothetical protein, partial [Olavius algarvensis Gamma 3 endosymbiont]
GRLQFVPERNQDQSAGCGLAMRSNPEGV